MIIFQDLKELLEIIIKYENKLTDFYEVAENRLKNEECKAIITMFKEKHLNNLKIIQDIRVEDYGKDEWVQYTSDFNIKDLLTYEKIKYDSTHQEIINQILQFEEKMKELYTSISQHITTRDEKELFDSLVQFKSRQIFVIKTFMEV